MSITYRRVFGMAAAAIALCTVVANSGAELSAETTTQDCCNTDVSWAYLLWSSWR